MTKIQAEAYTTYEYWLNLLKDTDYIDDEIFLTLQPICNELISMLVATIKTCKNKELKTKN